MFVKLEDPATPWEGSRRSTDNGGICERSNDPMGGSRRPVTQSRDKTNRATDDHQTKQQTNKQTNKQENRGQVQAEVSRRRQGEEGSQARGDKKRRWVSGRRGRVPAKSPEALTEFGFVPSFVRMDVINCKRVEAGDDSGGVSEAVSVDTGSGAGKMKGGSDGGILERLKFY